VGNAAAFASFRTSPGNAQVLLPDVTVRESARVCVDDCIGPRCWLGNVHKSFSDGRARTRTQDQDKGRG